MIGTLVVSGALVALLGQQPKDFFQTFTPDQVLWMVAGVFALLDIVLLAYAVARFQRAKLILS